MEAPQFLMGVTDRAKRVLVVGNGPSVELCKKTLFLDAVKQGVRVIAVNGAVDWLPACTDFFTLDASPINRKRMMAKRPHVKYWAAVPLDYGRPDALSAWHRQPAEPGVHYLKRVRGGIGLSTDSCLIYSGNSAYGAMQLAGHMQARYVAMLGVDCTRQKYAHSNTKSHRPLGHVPDLMASLAVRFRSRGVHVINGSPDSLVTCWPKGPASETVEWLIGAGFNA